MAGKGRRNADAMLVAFLASGQTIVEAAHLAGISERTARRRCADPAFQELISQQQAAMLSAAAGKLADLAAAAADTLGPIIRGDAGASAKIAASRLILNGAPRLRDHAEIDARLRQLEQQRKPVRRKSR